MGSRSEQLLNLKPEASGFIPCYNNEDTIAEAIDGLKNQNTTLEEIFVVDDGSADASVEIARNAGVEVLVHPENLGRGAARRTGIKRAGNEFILCCDATNRLAPDFLDKALPHFENKKIASVSGRIVGGKPRNAIDRWRSRHLFKEEVNFPGAGPDVMLITYGTLMRRSPILEVGNFDATLRHTEDGELGNRLLAAGYEIWGDCSLMVTSLADNSLKQVLERYWRWYAGKDEPLSLANYWHDVKGSVRPMATSDLAKGDWCCAAISLLSPHYRFWKTLTNKFKRR